MPAPQRTLEERLLDVEDRLAILNIIAGHPPGTDSQSDDYSGSYWLEGGVFDRGPGFGEQPGRGSGNGLQSPGFTEAVRQGISHFTGPPYIEIDGDTAIATVYLQILAPNPFGEEFTLSAHGTTKGFRVHRLTASRWDFVRTEDGWKVKRRALRPMDTAEARALLRGVAERKTKKDAE